VLQILFDQGSLVIYAFTLYSSLVMNTKPHIRNHNNTPHTSRESPLIEYYYLNPLQ